jgi:hypothetical protein
MSKQIAKKEENKLAVPSDVSVWGDPEVTSNDIMIPRILAMQGMSEMVTSGKAKFGEIVESLNGEVLGGFDKSFEIIVFRKEMIWRIESANGKELFAVEPLFGNPASPQFNDDPRNVIRDLEHEGKAARKVKAYNFYVLRPDEIEAEVALPYMVQLKVTSIRAAKKIVTQAYVKNRAAGKGPVATVFNLSIEKQSNDDGTFAVFDVSVKRDATKKEYDKGLEWFKTLNAEAPKVHSEDEVPF